MAEGGSQSQPGAGRQQAPSHGPLGTALGLNPGSALERGPLLLRLWFPFSKMGIMVLPIQGNGGRSIRAHGHFSFMLRSEEGVSGDGEECGQFQKMFKACPGLKVQRDWRRVQGL